MPSEQERADFETWAETILGDNPTWRGSGDCELAWQAWQAARRTPPAQAGAGVVEVRAVTPDEDATLRKAGMRGATVIPHPDTARLDWLEQHARSDWEDAGVEACWYVPTPLRAKIDAARAAQAQGGSDADQA